MWNNDYIPTPWRLRWTRFCYRGLPVLGFLGCLAATFWLWQRQGHAPMLSGEVLAVRVDVTSGRDGVLTSLGGEPWRLYDTVEANQIIARLDDRIVFAQLDVGRKELVRIRAELDAADVKNIFAETDRGLYFSRQTAEVAAEHERLIVWVLERKLQMLTDRLELQRHDARLEHFKPLHEKGEMPNLQWIEENLSRSIVVKRLEDGVTALQGAEREEKMMRELMEKIPARATAETAKVLAPFRAAIASQQARVRELELACEQLIIRTPVDGVICSILHRPGENVRAGDVIVTVANPRAQGIVSYLRQDDRLRPLPGMTAEVRLRLPASRAVATRVERVGPQFEPLPLHLCRDPKIPEWGLPVFITIPDGLSICPGELLDVWLVPEGG
jgi:multidrug resistance efflux pump